MILYVGLIALLSLQGMKLRFRSFNEDYISKDSTDAVRGIFILLIFAAHFNGYVDLTITPLDIAYRKVWLAMGQTVVTCFLFYSGYGVALSAKKKGDAYVRAMPRNRILPTLLIFDCSVILYLLLQLSRGRAYSLKDFVLALLAWESFGNSNWYIFAILGCYLITWTILRGRELDRVTVARITACTVVFILALVCAGRDPWWYNTLLCYPLGMWYFLYQGKIDHFMSQSIVYWPVLALTAVAFVVAHKFWNPSSGPVYMLTMLLFALCVVFLTMKIQLHSSILIYCGRHLQGLYLIHRIPFIILGDIFPWKSGPSIYVYFTLGLVGTFLLESAFFKVITFLQGRPLKKDEIPPIYKPTMVRAFIENRRSRPSEEEKVYTSSFGQVKAVHLFYALAIPVFAYVFIVAIAAPTNSYDFLPVLTVVFVLLTLFALRQHKGEIRTLLFKWCGSKVVATAAMVLWGLLIVCFSLVFRVEYTWDYGGAIRASYQWATEGFVGNLEAYSRYPNNTLLLTILCGACKVMLFFSPNASVEAFRVVGCLLSSSSIFISGFVFLKTGELLKKGLGKIFLLLYMTCIPLWLYSTICYTDTLGLPLLAGAFWCLTKMIGAGTQKSRIIWLILHSSLMGIAFCMKVTLAIAFIAALVFCVLSYKKKKDMVLCVALALAVFASTSSLVSWGAVRLVGITPELREKYEFPKTHWVMMSMNTQKETYCAGGYQQSDVDYTKSFENRMERDAAVKERLLDRLKNPQRSLVEHILFQKVRRTWSNGSLAADDYAGRGPIKRGVLHDFFLCGGEDWKFTRAVMQLWWVFLLGASLLSMIYQYRERKLSPMLNLHLTAFGFFLFYLIWETNSRYLVVFVPVLTLSAADGICKFFGLDLPHMDERGDEAS